jgi:hypothetical protein
MLCNADCIDGFDYTSFHTKPMWRPRFYSGLPKSSEGKESFPPLPHRNGGRGMVRLIQLGQSSNHLLRKGQVYYPKNFRISMGEENAVRFSGYANFFRCSKTGLLYDDGIVNRAWGATPLSRWAGADNIKAVVEIQLSASGNFFVEIDPAKIINHGFDETICSISEMMPSCEYDYIPSAPRVDADTGPPFYKIKDPRFCRHIQEFDGKKISCGGTTPKFMPAN